MEEAVAEVDPWLASDKLQHFLFCFSLTMIFSILATQIRSSFIRNRSIIVGSLFSLSAGAAKEVADHFGFFHSAGASAKDALADAVGVLAACFVLSLYKSRSRSAKSDLTEPARGISLV